ncbi:hypothetical protein G6F56_014034 [Rhizopus delemar]|nr:hypothetical protein G6F56_014034 [Rhizopus delemar]
MRGLAGSNTTAATATGPASGPRPASSTPAIRRSGSTTAGPSNTARLADAAWRRLMPWPGRASAARRPHRRPVPRRCGAGVHAGGHRCPAGRPCAADGRTTAGWPPPACPACSRAASVPGPDPGRPGCWEARNGRP